MRARTRERGARTLKTRCWSFGRSVGWRGVAVSGCFYITLYMKGCILYNSQIYGNMREFLRVCVDHFSILQGHKHTYKQGRV